MNWYMITFSGLYLSLETLGSKLRWMRCIGIIYRPFLQLRVNSWHSERLRQIFCVIIALWKCLCIYYIGSIKSLWDNIMLKWWNSLVWTHPYVKETEDYPMQLTTDDFSLRLPLLSVRKHKSFKGANHFFLSRFMKQLDGLYPKGLISHGGLWWELK